MLHAAVVAFTESNQVRLWLGVIAAIPLTIAAIGGWRGAKAAQRAKEAIGVPNGKGNVVQMLETLLAGQTGQDARLARLEAHDVTNGVQLSALDERVRKLEHPE